MAFMAYLGSVGTLNIIRTLSNNIERWVCTNKNWSASKNVIHFMWTELSQVLQFYSTNYSLYMETFSPKNIYIDYELSIHTAALSVWPSVVLKGCRFHLGQAWYRKIQNLGLSLEYQSKSSEVGNYLKLFFGLPFLPPEEVGDCFTMEIMAIQPTGIPAVESFTDYILNNYILDSSRFPPMIWAEFSENISRTTNACESFHSKLNNMFYKTRPNIYVLLEALNEVQTMTTVKINTIRNVRRSKQTLEKEQFIRDQIKKYITNKDRLAFIKIVSRKFLPNAYLYCPNRTE
uniref:MULE transposase domain-containing protein n=2 Tax=Cacopsylla melanoneura TaxID=428564 RepID=A0A8D8LA82_9HEMI